MFSLELMEEKKVHVSLKERLESLKLAVQWTYRSSKALTFIVFTIAIFGGLLTIVEPYFFKIIIDKVTNPEELTKVEQAGLGILGILFIYGIAKITQSMLWDAQTVIKKVHSQKLDRHASHVLMEKISSLDTAYFEDSKYYNTLTKASQNLYRINEFFWQFTFLTGQLVGAIVIIAALLTFHWIVAVLILFAAMPSILIALRKTKTVWGIFDSYSPISRQSKYYQGLMMESPQAIKEIKLFDLQSHFLGKFNTLAGKFIKKQETTAKKELIQYFFMGFFEVLFSIIAAALVVFAFIRGEITIGQFTFFWALLFQFSEHVRWIVRLGSELNEHATFISPFVKILNFKPFVKEAEKPLEFPVKLKKNIEFRNVTFYYPGAKRPALKNFNLIIKPEESIALVGENGSGKTTIIKLLTRLYDVSEGEILIDNINIKEYSIKSLYKNIGVIFQDFMKYEALLKENVGFGRVSEIKNYQKISEASKKSGAAEFISELDKGYETHLGKTLKEEGVELSIGQWQKVALARAFFKDAQILCLDEPTAAVDAKTEYQLFKKFENLTKNKTSILISHRFSTVRMSHKIVVIDKGKIVEEGTHRELMNRKGLYAKMFRLQAEGYRDYFEK